MRGRKKIVLSNSEKEKRFEVGKRIRYLREKEGLSQTKLAQMLYCSRQQIGFYENGKCPVPSYIAEKMANIFHVIPPYILCESNETSWNTWDSELEKAEDEGLTQWENKQAEEKEKKRVLFSMCGYQYRYLDGPSYDFASLLPDADKDKELLLYKAYHPHELTDLSAPDKHYYFDESELEVLISSLKDVIAFTCFKKEQKGDPK